MALGVILGLAVGAVVVILGDDGGSPFAPVTTDDTGADDDEPAVVYLLAGQEIEATVGDRLELSVEENPGVGDAWQVAEAPDDGVARVVDRFSEGVDTEVVGAGHTEVFVLEALGPGTTALVLHNCFRCDDAGVTPAEDAQYAVDLRYGIRVTDR